MSPLTREEFLNMSDIAVKLITVPATIPVWGGQTLYIKQLTRGQQDEYLRRQFGTSRMKQDAKAKQQEMSEMNLWGHDSWICSRSVCNEDGQLLFKETDIDKIKGKSGEAIGWIAKEIIAFSGMTEDAKVASGEVTLEESLAEEIKN